MTLFVLACCLGAAGLMGYSIQRGATCTVAAVDEVVTRGSCRRLLAMAEAALWVPADRWRHATVRPLAALRCTAGGALMAWGTLLIPGGNDGLILLGMPLLWPYAWVAFATMCATVAAALVVQRGFAKAPPRA